MIVLLNSVYDDFQKANLLRYFNRHSIPYELLKAEGYEAYHISKAIEHSLNVEIQRFSIVKDVIMLQGDREIKGEQTQRGLKDMGFENEPLMIAGPCSVESEQQLTIIAKSLKETGVKFLRGGAFKPRTSPYSFQGLEEEGLKILHRVAKKFDMVSVSEIVKISDLPLFESYVDIIQIGSRNMHNYALLKEISKSKKPIILKRGFASTIEEWLMSAQYLVRGGNKNIILCERGIRTFEPSTRFTLDLNGLLKIKQLSDFPVIVDP